MARRIVCTTQKPAGASHDEAHIESVGIGLLNGRSTRMESVETVRQNIASGTTYYTKVNGVRAEVHPMECSCDYKTIRSDPDGTTQNNLDELPRC